MEKKIDQGIHSSDTQDQLLLTEIIRRLLCDFRQQMLLDIRTALHEKDQPNTKQWIKSAEIRKLLNISHGTLQTLRNKGVLPFTRIGGVIYYSQKDIEKMMTHNKGSHDEK